jgi:hypothetical protein
MFNLRDRLTYEPKESDYLYEIMDTYITYSNFIGEKGYIRENNNGTCVFEIISLGVNIYLHS